MTLDHLDLLCRHAGRRQRQPDGRRLPVHRRREIACLGRAVIVERGALDHRPDVIPVRLRVRQTLQRHTARAGAKDSALRAVVERVTFAVRRQDLVLFVEIAAPLRQLDRNTTRQRHVHLSCAQGGDGVVDRHKRGGASGLQVDRGTFQIKHMAHTGRQEVLVVAGVAQQEHAHIIDQIGD